MQNPTTTPAYMIPPRLADILDARHNSFGVLRLAMALAVLVSHSFWLATGASSNEPLHGITGFTLGEHAVQVFFLMSGLLVANALERSRSTIDFALGRILRIFPGLVICVALTALVLGPMVSALPPARYFADPGLVAYLGRTMGLVSASVPLPGVFEALPVPGLVNGSLWTLKFEVICYFALGCLSVAGLLRPERRRLAIATLVAVIAVSAAVLPGHAAKYTAAQNVAYFAIHFGLGVLACLLKSELRVSGVAALALAIPAALTIGTPLQNLSTAVFLGYGALSLSTLQFGPLRTACNRTDLSYGTYIYAMPVQQALIAANPGIGALALTAVALGPVLVLAWLSWTLVERPAMGLRRTILGRLVPAPAGPASPDLIRRRLFNRRTDRA